MQALPCCPGQGAVGHAHWVSYLNFLFIVASYPPLALLLSATQGEGGYFGDTHEHTGVCSISSTCLTAQEVVGVAGYAWPLMFHLPPAPADQSLTQVAVRGRSQSCSVVGVWAGVFSDLLLEASAVLCPQLC